MWRGRRWRSSRACPSRIWLSCGLIIKNDAIIIVEFKDYEGSLVARQNGDWTCDGKAIKGGNGGKSVFEQLRKNQRILRKVIAENGYFTEAQRSDIKGLVVLTKLKSYSDDFDRSNKAWIFVSDIDNIGNKMHDIVSADFRDARTGRVTEVDITDEDIFNFLRKMRIDESSIVTDIKKSADTKPTAAEPHIHSQAEIRCNGIFGAGYQPHGKRRGSEEGLQKVGHDVPPRQSGRHGRGCEETGRNPVSQNQQSLRNPESFERD